VLAKHHKYARLCTREATHLIAHQILRLWLHGRLWTAAERIHVGLGLGRLRRLWRR
jgi:hypothetical protein